MKRILLLAAAVLFSTIATADICLADTNLPQPSTANHFKKSLTNDAPVSQITHKSPVDVVNSAPVGTLHNPFTGKPDMIAEGKKVFFGKSCNGCHGGGGGGGMCPSLKNDIWVYGSDDDTLFRLIALGSQGLQSKGYVRKGMESVVGPMPPFGGLIKDDEEEFKLIAFLRSLYDGDKARINW